MATLASIIKDVDKDVKGMAKKESLIVIQSILSEFPLAF